MHASYAAKLPVLNGKKCTTTYHAKLGTAAGDHHIDPSPEITAERRAAWVALGGAPLREPNGTRHTVKQSDIFGRNCCKGHSRCEWLEYHVAKPSKCGWFGDELDRVSPYAVARVNECLTDKNVPSKEEVENEQ